jgi:hypothetical protein
MDATDLASATEAFEARLFTGTLRALPKPTAVIVAEAIASKFACEELFSARLL